MSKRKKDMAIIIEEDLLGTTLKNKSNDLYDRYINIKKEVLKKIASRQQDLENTEAGSEHLCSVHRILGDLLPLKKLENLRHIEIFCLLVSVYLHDIGKIQQRKINIKEHHSVASRKIIIEYAIKLGLEEPEALIVGCIVEGHGLIKISELPYRKSVAPYGIVRIRFLAALLRLADDLDTCYTRAPKIIESLVEPRKSIKSKWSFRQCIDNVNIDPNTWLIEVEATPKNNTLHENILREVEIINGSLIENRPFLRATPDIGLYYSIIDVKIDNFWIKNIEKTITKNKGNKKFDKKQVYMDLPENTVTVIMKYDPSSIELYKEVIKPILVKKGFNPILIDELPPEDTLLKRTLEVISNSKIIITLLSGTGVSSIFFRLGISLGLHKNVIVLSTPDSSTIGDLCGLQKYIFHNKYELKSIINKQL